MNRHSWFRFLIPVLLLCTCCNWSYGSGIDTLIKNFANSDFIFQREISNTPFPPLAYLAYYNYSDSELRTSEGSSIEFDQSSLSQGLVFPWLISQRDALFAGEWISRNEFNTDSPHIDDFNVTSVGIPLGWLRQVNPHWQAAAFVFPIVHNSNLPQSKTSYEFMGGAFTRFVQTEHLWWGLGLFVDSDQGGDLYLPYIGLSWAASKQWTISAIMPWPAILYSPTINTTFRIGSSPTGASWILDQDNSDLYYDWDSWNFGFAYQQRIKDNFWLQVELGGSGLHNLSIQGDHWQSPELKADSSVFLGISLNWRPSAPSDP